MGFEVIVTLGPSIFGSEKIKEIDSLGECIFRINGAHADEVEALEIINSTRNILPDAKIMMDLPGNKIRTKNILEPIVVNKGQTFCLLNSQTNFNSFHEYVQVGDIVLASDSTLTLEVLSSENGSVEFLAHSDGVLEKNKGIHIRGINEDMPFLFERDRNLIEVACSEKLDYLSLSFVRDDTDISEVKNLLPKENEVTLVAKIETAAAIRNLEKIMDNVNVVNIDRGDLSAEIGMMNIPETQSKVIKSGLSAGIRVFLATQFLKNMEVNPLPLISETISMYNAMNSGISGIQLSEETAVGKYPVECVKFIFDFYRKIKTEFKS